MMEIKIVIEEIPYALNDKQKNSLQIRKNLDTTSIKEMKNTIVYSYISDYAIKDDRVENGIFVSLTNHMAKNKIMLSYEQYENNECVKQFASFYDYKNFADAKNEQIELFKRHSRLLNKKKHVNKLKIRRN